MAQSVAQEATAPGRRSRAWIASQTSSPVLHDEREWPVRRSRLVVMSDKESVVVGSLCDQ